jgi:hypothetical protein
MGVGAVVALGAYVYAAANTVPATAAGAGSAAISGYTVSGVSYTLNASNPANIDAIQFDISPTAAATVKTQLATGGPWYVCANTSGSVSCSTTSPQATVASANQLTVVAVD